MNTGFEAGLIKFLLVLIRCSAFLILTPVFGRREMPVQGKIALSGLISMIVSPLIPEINYDENFVNLALLIIREITVGLSIGYITLLMFSALYVAGEIVDLEMGFGIVNVIDPQSNSRVPLMGNFYYMLTLLIFLTLNGHHVLISAVIKSFEIVPIGKAVFKWGFLSGIITSFNDMFLIGVKVGLPVISIIFLTDFALGIIARTVPQVNVFLVGLPVKIAIGITAMILILPAYIVALDVIFNGTYDNIFTILRGMWKGP